MSPSYIQTLFLWPGKVMETSPDPAALLPYREVDEGFLWLDHEALGGHIWAPERGALVSFDEIKVVAGKLAETLFAVTGVTSIECGVECGGLIECMSEGGWEDLKSEIGALHEVARTYLPAGHEDLATVVSFIGFWRAVMSHDWEYGPELDCIEFASEGVVATKPVDPNPTTQATVTLIAPIVCANGSWIATDPLSDAKGVT